MMPQIDANHLFRSGVFTCRALVSLHLHGDVHLNSEVSLPKVKLLHFEGVPSVVDDSLERLIKGCPSLEEAKLVLGCRDGNYNNLGEQISMSGIFRSKALVSLRLVVVNRKKLSVVLPNSVCLPNLKLLYLDGFSLANDDSLGCLIRGCLVLEQLIIRGLNCSNIGVEVLHIPSSHFLKTLMFQAYGCHKDMFTIVVESSSLECLFYTGYGKHQVLVKAPNLKYFDYLGDADRVNFSENPKSPFRARIGVQTMFKDETESSSDRVQKALDLTNDLQNAVSLYLSDCTMEREGSVSFPQTCCLLLKI